MKAIIGQKASKKADDLTLMWMSNNLTKEGFENMVTVLQRPLNISKSPSISPAEVQKDWARLASFMRGKK